MSKTVLKEKQQDTVCTQSNEQENESLLTSLPPERQEMLKQAVGRGNGFIQAILAQSEE